MRFTRQANTKKANPLQSGAPHTTTHARWNLPLQPPAWEGLPPKPWRQTVVSSAP